MRDSERSGKVWSAFVFGAVGGCDAMVSGVRGGGRAGKLTPLSVGQPRYPGTRRTLESGPEGVLFAPPCKKKDALAGVNTTGWSGAAAIPIYILPDTRSARKVTAYPSGCTKAGATGHLARSPMREARYRDRTETFPTRRWQSPVCAAPDSSEPKPSDEPKGAGAGAAFTRPRQRVVGPAG